MAFLLQQDDLSISQHYDLNMQEKHLSSLYQHKPTDVEEIYFHLLTPTQCRMQLFLGRNCKTPTTHHHIRENTNYTTPYQRKHQLHNTISERTCLNIQFLVQQLKLMVIFLSVV